MNTVVMILMNLMTLQLQLRKNSVPNPVPFRRGLAFKEAALFVLLVSSAITPPAARAQSTLWYNGDLFGQSATINQIVGTDAARVFDNFTVTDPLGWRIMSVFSNNLLGGRQNVTQADWSIRSGMSAGNGGTIIAGGVGAATRTATGRSPNFLYDEYTIQVSNLSVVLGPGTYWLNVTPLFSGEAYNSVTRGSNAIGLPRGNDGNAFLNWPSEGFNYVSQGTDNFSMGVRGVAVAPEPGSLALALIVGLPLVGVAVRRRINSKT